MIQESVRNYNNAAKYRNGVLEKRRKEFFEEFISELKWYFGGIMKIKLQDFRNYLILIISFGICLGIIYFADNIFFFPKRDILSFDVLAENKDTLYKRIECLNAIKENKANVIVTTIEAVSQKMIAKKNFI